MSRLTQATRRSIVGRLRPVPTGPSADRWMGAVEAAIVIAALVAIVLLAQVHA